VVVIKRYIFFKCFFFYSGYSTKASASAKNVQKIFGSVCIERMPIVSKELNELEQRYIEYINKTDLSKSVFSDHELRHQKDL
jgi:hypothetical protein